MANARKVRTGLCVLLAALTAGVASAEERNSQAPAPIIYAKPTTVTRAVRIENTAKPSAFVTPSTSAPLTFGQFQGRTGAAIDLRPGTLAPASYGPMVSSITPAPLARGDDGLRSRPQIAPGAMAMAEPYAGPPYQVEGRWFVPTHEPNYDEVGVASWYGPGFHEKAAATGEEFDENAFTAAHPTLPLPSLVRVTNLENGRSMVVRLNDRGPFVDDRIIDLSRATANALGVINKGTAKVRVQYVGAAPVEANTTLPETALADMPRMTPVVAYTPKAPVVSRPAIVSADPAPVIAAKPQGQGAAQPEQKGFFLQAGTFADLGNAHRLRDKMREFWPANVEAARVGDSEYFRVMLGPWASREEADMARERLEQTGSKTLLIARLD